MSLTTIFRFSPFVPLLLMSTPLFAATGGSWQQSPTWASETQTPRKAILNDDSRYQLSPFAPGSNNLSVDIGQVFLMGDLGSNYADNIGSQIHYTYGVSELFGFDASMGYSEHSDGAFSMTTLLAGLRTNLAWYDKVVPYAVFGLGFYRPSYQETVNTANGPTTSNIAPVLFGVHLGPGVHLEMTRKLFFGASITFHDVFGITKNTANGPKQVGGTFTSFFLNAGVTF